MQVFYVLCGVRRRSPGLTMTSRRPPAPARGGRRGVGEHPWTDGAQARDEERISEQAAHVFERFYRATPPGSGDTAPRTNGSGLGLAIVQTIAEAHGGAASVTSQPGKGSRFEITLPLG